MKLINTALIAHPMNWVIVFLMLTISYSALFLVFGWRSPVETPLTETE